MDMNESMGEKVHPTPAIGERREMKQGIKGDSGVVKLPVPAVSPSCEGRESFKCDLRNEEERNHSPLK